MLKIHPNYNERVYGLDVFRAIAILIVVMGHGSFLVNEFAPGFPYIRLIDGVELFFVLSGFLIGGILIRLFEKKQTLNLALLGDFWKRRWFRTLPNYYLILLANFLLVKYGITSGDINQCDWSFLVFMQNFSQPFVDFFWESWSLSIEEWFYLLTPVTILVIHKISGGKMALKNSIFLVIALYITGPLLYRIAISGKDVDPFWYDVTFRKVVVTRLDAIMYGVLFAWMKYYLPEQFVKYRMHLFIFGIILIYTVILLPRETTSWYSKTFYFSLTGIGASLLLPFADSIKSFRTRFGKWITHISIISYSMYLVNLGIVAAIIQKNFLPEEKSTSAYFMLYISYWLSVIILSTLLYKYFEKPMMDLRERKINPAAIKENKL